MKWRIGVYIDHCIPFGLCSAPKLFNILAVLAWIAQNAGISYLIHYLDDYLTMGSSTVCQHNGNTFVSLCAELGVPLATDKLQGPSTSLSFLGILLDSHRMEIRLPSDKLALIQELLKTWLLNKRQQSNRFVTSGHPSTTCLKSGMTRKSLCCQDVCHSSQNSQNALYYLFEHSFPIRFVLVACLPASLE